jgi:hypothetical protein
MKIKSFFLFFASILLIGTLIFSCNNKINKSVPPDGFVYIKGKEFLLNGKPFYPIILNYITDIQTDCKGNFWISPSRAYGKDLQYEYTRQDSSVQQFKADMQLIKDMGFNTVRLIHIGLTEKIDSKVAVKVGIGNNRDSVMILNKESYPVYFNVLQQMFSILDSIGLKAIVLLKALPEGEPIEMHLEKLLSHFKNEKALMAWDFFNEPLYFDTAKREKSDIYNLVNNWEQLMRKNAPNHLFTIGLTGVRETFGWDPNILAADFLSIHPYEFHPNEVINEIYWYGKFVDKPWIIGETGLPADDDSITYQKQEEFAKMAIDWSRNCGASGFSWWQYKDVNWNHFQSDYLGVISNKGKSFNSKKQQINGTIKPVSEVFKTFNPNVKPIFPNEHPSFYNYSNYSNYRIIGKLVNKKNHKSVKAGIVLAWNESFSNSTHTFTREDGTFELYSNFKMYHWIASASRMSVTRNDFDWDKSIRVLNNIPTFDLGVIELDDLSFLK